MSSPKYNPMASVEMVQWLEKGRAVAIADGEGNSLTLIELLSRHVFNELITRAAVADVSLTGLSLVAKSAISKMGLSASDQPSLVASYGVPQPKSPL